jgi:hypothetical protein
MLGRLGVWSRPAECVAPRSTHALRDRATGVATLTAREAETRGRGSGTRRWSRSGRPTSRRAAVLRSEPGLVGLGIASDGVFGRPALADGQVHARWGAPAVALATRRLSRHRSHRRRPRPGIAAARFRGRPAPIRARRVDSRGPLPLPGRPADPDRTIQNRPARPAGGWRPSGFDAVALDWGEPASGGPVLTREVSCPPAIRSAA